MVKIAVHMKHVDERMTVVVLSSWLFVYSVISNRVFMLSLLTCISVILSCRYLQEVNVTDTLLDVRDVCRSRVLNASSNSNKYPVGDGMHSRSLSTRSNSVSFSSSDNLANRVSSSSPPPGTERYWLVNDSPICCGSCNIVLSLHVLCIAE